MICNAKSYRYSFIVFIDYHDRYEQKVILSCWVSSIHTNYIISKQFWNSDWIHRRKSVALSVGIFSSNWSCCLYKITELYGCDCNSSTHILTLLLSLTDAVYQLCCIEIEYYEYPLVTKWSRLILLTSLTLSLILSSIFFGSTPSCNFAAIFLLRLSGIFKCTNSSLWLLW